MIFTDYKESSIYPTRMTDAQVSFPQFFFFLLVYPRSIFFLLWYEIHLPYFNKIFLNGSSISENLFLFFLNLSQLVLLYLLKKVY